MAQLPNDPMLARWTSFGVPLSPYPLPPRDLAVIVATGQPANTRPPQGLLADHVGAAYPAHLMEDEDRHERTTWPLLRWVRAFPVAGVIGTTVGAAHPVATMAALVAHLTTLLPGMPWDVNADAMLYPFVAALHKYALVVSHLPAPPDLATGQAMGLDVALRITHLNGHPIQSPPGQALKARVYALDAEVGDVAVYQGWLDGIQLAVTQLTYTNMRGTGIHLPWYM